LGDGSLFDCVNPLFGLMVGSVPEIGAKLSGIERISIIAVKVIG
jgi:hypothetical protein